MAKIYAGTGTIYTSDKREKQQIRPLSEAERAVAVRLKGLVRAFKFNNEVDDGQAKIHFGVIAQEIQDAFWAEGLDPSGYGLLSYEEWESERDELGNEIKSAGNRYGVRYNELLAFIISAL
jgi:hypothetical protein